MRAIVGKGWPFCLAVILGLLAMSAGAAQAQEKTFPVITGEHWMKATPEQRLAFVAGMATIIELEKEIQGANPLPKEKSLISSWIKGLQPLTLKEIVAALDDYYTTQPDQMNRSVVEVMWFQLAAPNLKKQ